ncbi:MAG: twin-arginine translocation signal domain-containing protein [Deltaproteobacteria bacterium]|nr:MAG: twin-arginine translocation signal domain-containing protein [Deltaproteobacteria bacterium]
MKEGTISRRNFLKGTAIGAGALAVGVGGASVLTGPRMAHAADRLGYLPITTIDPDAVIKNVWKWYNTGGG